MRRVGAVSCSFFSVVFLASTALAQNQEVQAEASADVETNENPEGEDKEAVTEDNQEEKTDDEQGTDGVAESTDEIEGTPREDHTSDAAATVIQENRLSWCKDGKDNDGDGHVDCDDQDCLIYAVCVAAPKAATESAPLVVAPPLDPPEDVWVRRPFRLGFVPGVSTDSGFDALVVNHFSLNFIGMGDYLKGVEYSSLGAIRRHDVTGMQSSGLFNVNLGDTRGWQGSGVINFNRWDFSGFQGAGTANVTLGEFRGFQAAGTANVSGNFGGFQGAGTVNVALGGVKGFQASGVANVSRGSWGFQGAGVTNVSLDSVYGFQGAGVANVANANAHGFQGAGVANVANGDMKGLQAAGVVNVATGQVTGAQIGLINFGRSVRGTQIGLINIATEEMKGGAVGLVNYAGDGMFAPTFWMADSSMLNLGLKMGSKYVYGILGGGGHPVKRQRLSVVAGIGGHIELVNNFWLEIDLLHHALRGERSWRHVGIDFIEQGRINLGYRIAHRFSVYVGPAINLLVSDERQEVGFIPPIYINRDDGTNVALSVGLTAGIQWEPQIGRLNSRR